MYQYFLFLSFFAMSYLLAVPTTMSKKEQRYIKHIESIRENGFVDREVDRLHGSISAILARTKVYLDKGFYEKTKQYMADEAVDGHKIFLADKENLIYYHSDIFFQDEEGKTYIVVDLGQGLSYNDFPSRHIFERKAFVYPSDDFLSLSKVIVQFKRVDATDKSYVREMRRIINLTPVASQPMKFEGEKVKGDLPKLQEELIVADSVKADTNDDILLEYYTSNDGVNVWPDLPILKQKPALVAKLNDKEDLLDYRIQKKLFDQYREALRKINKDLEHRLYLMELNKRGTNFKMLAEY
jgi:hypothetical protein